MADRGFIGHLVLASLTTAAAALAYLYPHAVDEAGTAVVIDPGGAAVTELAWEDDGVVVTLTRTADGARLRHRRRPPPRPQPEAAAAADGGRPATPAGGGTDPATPADTGAEVVYPASAAGVALFTDLAPLRAARALGHPEPAALAAFGLDPPLASFRLTAGGATTTLAVGEAAYGSADLYVRAADGNVFLLHAQTLAPLQHGALGLRDTRAIGLEPSAFDEVALTVDGRQRRVVQRHADDPGQAFLADPAEPDKKLPRLTHWIASVLRLRVLDPAPAAPTAPPRITVQFATEGRARETIKIWAGTATTAPVAMSGRFEVPMALARVTAEAVLAGADAASTDAGEP